MQAAAYGLPIVATKNGGPVDIIRVSISLFMMLVMVTLRLDDLFLSTYCRSVSGTR